jgi:Helix-turn-helix domain
MLDRTQHLSERSGSTVRRAGYLMTTNDNLLTIAGRTGYDSEASLSKAFKRQFGQPPGEYRRQSLATLIPVGMDAGPERSVGHSKPIASSEVRRSNSGHEAARWLPTSRVTRRQPDSPTTTLSTEPNHPVISKGS